MESNGDKKDAKFQGELGETKLKEDHRGVRGENGHHLGINGTKPYIESILKEPEVSIPGKGGYCKTPIISNYIEMNLTPEDLSTYLMYVAIKQAGPDEKIENCPFCKYYEIWHKDCTSNFFYCKLEGCKKGSCSVCHKEFKLPKSETRITAEEEKQMFGEDGMFSHLKGYEYKDLKAEWDQAIINGNQRFCPECGLGGMKDDACTHITGAKCNNKYCYVGGIAEKNLDKSDPKGSIYSHNTDWENNEKRCPMWLDKIGTVDDRWNGKSREEGVLYFHRLLVYKNIKELIEKHGVKKLRTLEEVFDSVTKHGYDLEEAMTLDLTLVKIN